MKLVIFLAVLTLSSAAPKPSKLNFRNLYKASSRVIGGQAVTPHSLPFQAFLEILSDSKTWYCGGSLISENYVLTAAHCLEGAAQVLVTLGAHRPLESEPTQLHAYASGVKFNEFYSSEELINDIAVVQLSASVILTDAIGVVPLPSISDVGNNFVGDIATLSGWGSTDGQNNFLSEVLNYVNLTIIANEDCSTYFGTLTDSILCTSGLEDTGACNGDSGAPLISDGKLIGVVSFGVEYCPGGFPTAYSKVSSFLTWLGSNTDVNITI